MRCVLHRAPYALQRVSLSDSIASGLPGTFHSGQCWVLAPSALHSLLGDPPVLLQSVSYLPRIRRQSTEAGGLLCAYVVHPLYHIHA